MPKPSAQIDPNHQRRQSFMRYVGIGLLISGVILTAVGLISFFTSFGTFGPPRYFWATFLGLPLIAIGSALTLLGNLDNYYRYFAEELTPAGSEVFRNLATESQQAVETVAQAVGRGIAMGIGGAPAASSEVAETVDCKQCGSANPRSARFCNQCGVALGVGVVPWLRSGRCRQRSIL